ncbi:unnamed protein product, partial [Phaeothamnion confervicola]
MGEDSRMRLHFSACYKKGFPVLGLYRKKVIHTITEIYAATARSFASMIQAELYVSPIPTITFNIDVWTSKAYGSGGSPGTASSRPPFWLPRNSSLTRRF